MTRTDYVLAVMAGVQGVLTPVQIQKLFFILDMKAAENIGGKRFSFTPYNYGPFDPEVYHEIESLSAQGLTFVDGPGTSRRYGITSNGMLEGLKHFSKLPADTQNYIRKLGDYVRALSFAQLVSAVYAEWPEMKAKSIFRG